MATEMDFGGGCPDFDILGDFQSGMLLDEDPDEHEEVAEHVQDCSVCQKKIKEIVIKVR